MNALKDVISEDSNTHGSMLVPLVLGSDKTLASNATGQSEFHPLYLSLGNIKNSVRRAHRDALVPIGFLAIPKGTSVVRYLTLSDRHFQAHGKMGQAHCSVPFGANSCTNR